MEKRKYKDAWENKILLVTWTSGKLNKVQTLRQIKWYVNFYVKAETKTMTKTVLLFQYVRITNQQDNQLHSVEYPSWEYKFES